MKIKKGRETITTDIAYIAGFFDGEGCIRIKHASQGGSSYYIWVAITNSNKNILDYVMGVFGGKVRLAETRVNKPIYHYLITSSEAVDMLKMLIGFLRDKRKQAKLAIKFHENKERLTGKQKAHYANKMTELKHEIIGNIHESPELLDNETKRE